MKTMASLFNLVSVVLLMSFLCLVYSASDNEIRDSLEHEFRTLVELNESSYRMIAQLKRAVKVKEHDLSDCESGITRGFIEYLSMDKEKKRLEKERDICEEEVLELRHSRGVIVKASKAEYLELQRQEKQLKSELELCENSTKEIADCQCADCTEKIEQYKNSIEHYQQQNDGCEKMKISHKSMKYFMKKETARLKEEIVEKNDDLVELEVKLKNDGHVKKATGHDMDELRAEHIKLLEDEAYLQEDVKTVNTEYDTCRMAWAVVEQDKLVATNLMNVKEEKLKDIQQQCDTLETNIIVLGKDVDLHKRVMWGCLVVIGTTILTEIYFSGLRRIAKKK